MTIENTFKNMKFPGEQKDTSLFHAGLIFNRYAQGIKLIDRVVFLFMVAEPSQTVEVLIQAVLEGGGKDNVSAIVVFVS